MSAYFHFNVFFIVSWFAFATAIFETTAAITAATTAAPGNYEAAYD
jgi:hypothetical protein